MKKEDIAKLSEQYGFPVGEIKRMMKHPSFAKYVSDCIEQGPEKSTKGVVEFLLCLARHHENTPVMMLIIETYFGEENYIPLLDGNDE